MSIALYYHTLKYLKPVQVYGRVLFRYSHPQPDFTAAPRRRNVAHVWAQPARRRPSLSGPTRCLFLNEEHDISSARVWNDPAFEKLWLYNLHYFDDLNAEDAEARAEWHVALIKRWIAENVPGAGTGWEPYPVSLRIVNWIKWALGGAALPTEAYHSIAVQARWLTRRLEKHLLGNHLFANAKALVFAGFFFEGDEAETWFRQGLAILEKEVTEQVLADGGHFERSPMYHALILEDLLDLLNIFHAYDRPVPTGWMKVLRSMGGWLATMSHPDGEIALFNDAAIGIAPSPAEIDRYARALGLDCAERSQGRVTDLSESGYLRIEIGEAAVFLDVGKIGPDYLPGHAHADTLSFELSLFGRRLIVDSGTSCYGIGNERLRQRSTSAHNTVEVDEVSSSEIWSGFRVARRARPFDLRVHDDIDGILVSCGHDGYRRLPGRVIHRREWRFGERSLKVRDVVEGRYKKAVARFYLHPDVRVISNSSCDGKMVSGEDAIHWFVSGGDVAVVEGTWHPEFGQAIPNRCIEVSLFGPTCVMDLNW